MAATKGRRDKEVLDFRAKLTAIVATPSLQDFSAAAKRLSVKLDTLKNAIGRWVQWDSNDGKNLSDLGKSESYTKGWR